MSDLEIKCFFFWGGGNLVEIILKFVLGMKVVVARLAKALEKRKRRGSIGGMREREERG